MELLEKYCSTVLSSIDKVSNVLTQEEIQELRKSGDLLINNFRDNKYIRVPFVGDFSAGKSSLINALIKEEELLPTDFLPTTAVSYELHYCNSLEEQKIVLKNISTETIKEFKLEELKSLVLTPGDIVELYLFNLEVKKYYDNNIILVDMPGIDSGFESHQKAILNYLEKGTVFVIVNDIEFGNLRSSTINFISEINKYDLESLVVVSKMDKKLPEDGEKIISFIKNQVKTVLNKDYNVVGVSSMDNEIIGVSDFLNNLNAEKLFEEKNRATVIDFIDIIISKLVLSKELLSKEGEYFEDKIRHLEEEKLNIKQELVEKINNMPSVTEQVTDVLNRIKTEIVLNTNELVSLLLDGRKEELQERVMGIIRPILYEFNEKTSLEVDSYFTAALESFDQKLNNSLSHSNEGINFFSNKMVNAIPIELSKKNQNFVKGVLSSKVLMNAGKLLARFGGIAIVGLAAVFSVFHFYKKDKKQNEGLAKIEEAKSTFQNSVVGDLVGNFRDTVVNMLTEIQSTSKQNFIDQTNNAITSIEKELLEVKNKRQTIGFDANNEVAKIESILVELETLRTSM